MARYTRISYVFVCIGRQKRNDCTQRTLLIPWVEERVEEHYRNFQLDPKLREQIQTTLIDEFWSVRQHVQIENRLLTTQKERLTNERASLLQAHYAGAVPLDLLKAEQDRIARQLADIDSRLKADAIEFDQLQTGLRKALDYATNCYEVYMHARPRERRLLNQALLSYIEVSEEVIEFDPAEPFRVLLSDEMANTAQEYIATRHESVNKHQRHSLPSLTSVLQNETNAVTTVEPHSGLKERTMVTGLKESTLVEPKVELRGFEPLTPTLPVWCATNCAIAPRSCAHRSYTTGHCPSKLLFRRHQARPQTAKDPAPSAFPAPPPNRRQRSAARSR